MRQATGWIAGFAVLGWISGGVQGVVGALIFLALIAARELHKR